MLSEGIPRTVPKPEVAEEFRTAPVRNSPRTGGTNKTSESIVRPEGARVAPLVVRNITRSIDRAKKVDPTGDMYNL